MPEQAHSYIRTPKVFQFGELIIVIIFVIQRFEILLASECIIALV